MVVAKMNARHVRSSVTWGNECSARPRGVDCWGFRLRLCSYLLRDILPILPFCGGEFWRENWTIPDIEVGLAYFECRVQAILDRLDPVATTPKEWNTRFRRRHSFGTDFVLDQLFDGEYPPT
jgi:hypothetical protein